MATHHHSLRLATLAVALVATLSAAAQYNDISCSKRPFTTRIVQIDQLDSATVVFLEYHNDGQRYMNVNDDMVIRTDADGRTYRLLDSYNMPLTDESGTRQLVLDGPNDIHHFALVFERVPLELHHPMDIVEIDGNSRLMNFYDVEIDLEQKTDLIDYDQFVADSPLKEYGTYAQDGEVIQYMAQDGIIVSVHTTQTNEYGKHFTVDLNVRNYSDKPITIDPARITASSILPKQTDEQPLKVLSAEEYDKKVKRRQNWVKALVIAAEVAAVTATAVAESKAEKRDRDRHYHHDRPLPPPRPIFNPRPFRSYPTFYCRHYYHRPPGGFATVATAAIGAVATEAMIEHQKEKRAELQAGYILANTLQPGDEYAAYFNIEHKKTDNLVVNIPIGHEPFTFRFQWQDGKKK